MLTPFWRDWLERVGWTIAQVVVAVLITNVANLDGFYVPLLAAALAALKGYIAKHIGDPNSASTLKK